MGVRYNAEKKKIGNYYSTPIFSFRCKCHLCDGWFEIQTDPKNTRYVVVSGARQKDEDWNPEENGGYAVHDTEGSAAPADPLASLEKSTDAQKNLTQVQVPRLESLQSVSDHYNSDPYTLSRKIRKRFREEKKVAAERQANDDALKGRYGLSETLKLVDDTDEDTLRAKEEWEHGRQGLERQERNKRHKLLLSSATRPTALIPLSGGSRSSSSTAASSLRARLLGNTTRSSLHLKPRVLPD
ncbi:hypothetical protein ONZ45_g8651 [Pleurotus djamor]|nr:hypothetical protein ONZ45_g8651 [Pleurotus djamor]